MLKILVGVLCFLSCDGYAQSGLPVEAMDFVKVKDGRFAEALFFYENNWKVYRQAALEKGFITGYRLLRTQADSATDFHLVLVTTYADSLQFRRSEENFAPLIKALRPNGPLLLNNLRAADFRVNVLFKTAGVLWQAAKKED